MTNKKKTLRRRPGHTQESMLSVVAQVFTEYGYDAASLETIAKHLGLSKSAVYHHFASKEEILELALKQALDALESVFDLAETECETALEKISYIVMSAVQVAISKREYLTLLLRLHGNTKVEKQALEKRRALTSRLVIVFEQAKTEGSLRQDLDPWLAARYTFGTVNSLVEWYKPGGEISADSLAASVLQFVQSGFGTRN